MHALLVAACGSWRRGYISPRHYCQVGVGRLMMGHELDCQVIK
jgi:hypothetical protein